MKNLDQVPDLLTQVEAQQLFDASFDMLEALENLILHVGESRREELKLDVWIDAMKAVKKAGGILYI